MRIGICLTQLHCCLEESLVGTFYIRSVKPTFYFEVVADRRRAAYGCLAAYADIAPYRNITVYLFCWN